MQDAEIVNSHHAQIILDNGVKNKIHDSDFSFIMIDLIHAHGVAVALGVQPKQQAVNHFIASISFNQINNTSNKVQRETNIRASLTLLCVLAQESIDSHFA